MQGTGGHGSTHCHWDSATRGEIKPLPLAQSTLENLLREAVSWPVFLPLKWQQPAWGLDGPLCKPELPI